MSLTLVLLLVGGSSSSFGGTASTDDAPALRQAMERLANGTLDFSKQVLLLVSLEQRYGQRAMSRAAFDLYSRETSTSARRELAEALFLLVSRHEWRRSGKSQRPLDGAVVKALVSMLVCPRTSTLEERRILRMIAPYIEAGDLLNALDRSSLKRPPPSVAKWSKQAVKEQTQWAQSRLDLAQGYLQIRTKESVLRAVRELERMLDYDELHPMQTARMYPHFRLPLEIVLCAQLPGDALDAITITDRDVIHSYIVSLREVVTTHLNSSPDETLLMSVMKRIQLSIEARTAEYRNSEGPLAWPPSEEFSAKELQALAFFSGYELRFVETCVVVPWRDRRLQRRLMEWWEDYLKNPGAHARDYKPDLTIVLPPAKEGRTQKGQ